MLSNDEKQMQFILMKDDDNSKFRNISFLGKFPHQFLHKNLIFSPSGTLSTFDNFTPRVYCFQ